MAAQPTKLFQKKKPPTHSEEVSIFGKRQKARGVVWTDVDMALLCQLFQHCIAENIGIGLYSASGGRGVCFKLYRGKKLPDQEFANTAEEMSELIAAVLENLGETIDDSEEADTAD